MSVQPITENPTVGPVRVSLYRSVNVRTMTRTGERTRKAVFFVGGKSIPATLWHVRNPERSFPFSFILLLLRCFEWLLWDRKGEEQVEIHGKGAITELTEDYPFAFRSVRVT